MKILIIGQAPPAIKQKIPYDTTLLYEMLSWVDISKEQAQDMFEFDALTDKFPGYDSNGHMVPQLPVIMEYYRKVLKPKIQQCDKILVLGRVAEEFIKVRETLYPDKKFLYLIHPSRRNLPLVMGRKQQITKQLKNFIG